MYPDARANLELSILKTKNQAESYAIIDGLDLLENNPVDLTILTDNQALVKALRSEITTTKTIKTLKEKLNDIIRRKLTRF